MIAFYYGPGSRIVINYGSAKAKTYGSYGSGSGSKKTILTKTMTNLNDVLNAVMSIQLPFAIIPALCFSSSRLVMGDFR